MIFIELFDKANHHYPFVLLYELLYHNYKKFREIISYLSIYLSALCISCVGQCPPSREPGIIRHAGGVCHNDHRLQLHSFLHLAVWSTRERSADVVELYRKEKAEQNK